MKWRNDHRSERNIPTVDTRQQRTWLKSTNWQKDKQNFVSFLFCWSLLAFFIIEAFFTMTVEILTFFFFLEKKKRNSDMPYWLRAFKLWVRSIQPKFRPVRPGKEEHLKRWTSFFETFPVGPNWSIEFWTKIFGNFGWMDRALYLAGLTSWRVRIKFPLSVHEHNEFLKFVTEPSRYS